jgi:hypothetical protein
MARATTKSDLIKAATERFEKMWNLIDGITEEGQLAPFAFELTKSMKEAHWTRDKNLRDVLVHLYEWHQLLLNWFHSNQNGDAKPFLPKPYNWKTYGDMNVEFWKKHQATSYEDSRKMLSTFPLRLCQQRQGDGSVLYLVVIEHLVWLDGRLSELPLFAVLIVRRVSYHVRYQFGEVHRIL